MRPAKKARTIQRSVHLVASVLLLAYLYTPLGDNEIFGLMLRAMVVPVLTVSGLAMWQWPRIRRGLHGRGQHSATRRRPAGTGRAPHTASAPGCSSPPASTNAPRPAASAAGCGVRLTAAR